MLSIVTGPARQAAGDEPHVPAPLMKLRLASPPVLIDVGRIGELSYVRDAGDHVSIGALTRHRDVETSALLAEELPLLARVAGQVGDPQVRHRGTIAATPAVMNAVVDALAPFGVTDVAMPASPWRVWKAMQAGGAS